jgi:hypothetical protein
MGISLKVFFKMVNFKVGKYYKKISTMEKFIMGNTLMELKEDMVV